MVDFGSVGSRVLHCSLQPLIMIYRNGGFCRGQIADLLLSGIIYLKFTIGSDVDTFKR